MITPEKAQQDYEAAVSALQQSAMTPVWRQPNAWPSATPFANSPPDISGSWSWKFMR